MKKTRLETLILKNLVFDEDYVRKVLPFIKEEYFTENVEREVFRHVRDFFTKFNKIPTVEALEVTIGEKSKLSEEENSQAEEYLDKIRGLKETNQVKDWLLESTENFCKERAIHNALWEAVEIQNGEAKGKDVGMIPKILTDALAVSFDPNVGHDYLEDYEERYDYYHTTEKRIKFDLEMFNAITRGGLPIKTLNIILAGTGVGKTLVMCHFAAAAIMAGYNVLYITMEEAEEKIAMRVDANLLDVSLDDLEILPKDVYYKKVIKVREKATGKLIVKEYPTASAHTGHFRHLLNELNLKKSFKPDLVIVDYLNICTSSRIKNNGSVNSYTLVKSIAEELRGLAVEFKVPIVSATQTTRGGYGNSDVELTDTSESFGLPMTADFMFAVVTNEELEKMNQFMIKQLKTRYNDIAINRKFMVGVDRSKMRLYDVELDAQNLIEDADDEDIPFDKPKRGKDKFSGFKFKGDDDEH